METCFASWTLCRTVLGFAGMLGRLLPLLAVLGVYSVNASFFGWGSEPLKMAVHSDELITAVNLKNTTWKAGVNERFVGMTLEQAKVLLGTRLDKKNILPFISHSVRALPEEFNAIEHWFWDFVR